MASGGRAAVRLDPLTTSTGEGRTSVALNGAVDISPRAEMAISGEQLRDLWALARSRGVLIQVDEIRGSRDYLANVAGHGQQVHATADHPYKAAIAALERAA